MEDQKTQSFELKTATNSFKQATLDAISQSGRETALLNEKKKTPRIDTVFFIIDINKNCALS